MDRNISLAHGAGGEAYRQLVREVFLPVFHSEELAPLSDAAVLNTGGHKTAFTTDGYVVKPLFFPGGDIGRLAVCGTVNDLAVSGAKPRFLSVAMVIEAGLPIDKLKTIARSMADACKEAGVVIATGDTKVVEHGAADEIFITTAGVGEFYDRYQPTIGRVLAGDVIITSGPFASHGAAVMAARMQMDFSPPVTSDVRPLAGMIKEVLDTGADVHAMRDPTRGGAAATLCEWAEAGVNITIDEPALPVKDGARAVCALLGLDPLFCANEGVVLLSVDARGADKVLRALKSHPYGESAAIIGQVSEGGGRVHVQTAYGTKRRLLMPAGELLPRIC